MGGDFCSWEGICGPGREYIPGVYDWRVVYLVVTSGLSTYAQRPTLAPALEVVLIIRLLFGCTYTVCVQNDNSVKVAGNCIVCSITLRVEAVDSVKTHSSSY